MTGLSEYNLEPLGDSYVLMTFTHASDELKWLHAHSMCRTLDDLASDAIVSTYAAYDTLLVEFDMLRIDAGGVCHILRALAGAYSTANEEWLAAAVVYRMPVRYGGDIEVVADELDLSVSAFIELQTSEPIRIRCRGVAGSLMMSNPSVVPAIGRLPSPIIREIHVGEFNVAGRQCSVGFGSGRATIGWRNVGRTPADLSSAAIAACGFSAGDQILVEPIHPNSWNDYLGRPMAVLERI
jgi:allophanate hydrolase subunit 1